MMIRKVIVIKIIICIILLLNINNIHAQKWDDIIDLFFKRYTDYSQLYKDMAFTIGDWDALEKILNNEIEVIFNKNYKIYPVATFEGYSIVNVCDRRRLPYDMNYHFNVIDLPGKNAFAIPGGGVYITKDLVNAISEHNNSEGIYAFIFGHEVAHICKNHWRTLLKEQYVGEFWQWARNKISTDGNSQFLKDLVPLLMKSIFSGYSRDHEREADFLGMQYMKRAGYDIQGAVDALELLKLNSKDNVTIFSTHPDIDERINNALSVKSEIERLFNEELSDILKSCDVNNGVLSLNISQLKGNFGIIDGGPIFARLEINMFPENEKERIIEDFNKGNNLSITSVSFEKPDKYSTSLPIGNYIFFYKFKTGKQWWFTPFEVEENGWGPLRISINPQSITYINVTPNSSNSATYDMNSSRDINIEFMKRYFFEEKGKAIFQANFSPLPNDKAITNNINIYYSGDIKKADKKIILHHGSSLICVFNFSKGAPTRSKLTVNCSSIDTAYHNPGYMSITINGKELISNFKITSISTISQMWDITEFLQGGDNFVIFENEKTESTFTIYSLSIETEGVGIGNFYKISKNY